MSTAWRTSWTSTQRHARERNSVSPGLLVRQRCETIGSTNTRTDGASAAIGCYCTGRARDWLPGSFVYAKDNSARRTTQGSERMLPHAARAGETVDERLVECEVPVQNMPGPGVGEEAMGNRAVAVVAQRWSMEGGIDPKASADEQWRRRLAWRLG